MGGCGKEEWVRSRAFVHVVLPLVNLHTERVPFQVLLDFLQMLIKAGFKRVLRPVIMPTNTVSFLIFSCISYGVLEKLPMRSTLLFPKHPAQIPVWVLLFVLAVTVMLGKNALGGSHPPKPRVNKVMCITIDWEINSVNTILHDITLPERPTSLR